MVENQTRMGLPFYKYNKLYRNYVVEVIKSKEDKMNYYNPCSAQKQSSKSKVNREGKTQCLRDCINKYYP